MAELLRLDQRVVEVYLEELLTQFRYADAEWATLTTQVRSGRPDPQVCFGAAQSILTAAAQMSKIFWPNIDRKWSADKRAFVEQRGRALRGFVKPQNILRERSVRNGIEHFDERLDSFLMKGDGRTLVDHAVTPPDSFWDSLRDQPHPIMRNIDPGDLSIAVLDDRISLPNLMLAMRAASAEAARQRDEIWTGQFHLLVARALSEPEFDSHSATES